MWIGRKLSREDSRDTRIFFKGNGSLGQYRIRPQIGAVVLAATVTKQLQPLRLQQVVSAPAIALSH
jgi:hypothetical protein